MDEWLQVNLITYRYGVKQWFGPESDLVLTDIYRERSLCRLGSIRLSLDGRSSPESPKLLRMDSLHASLSVFTFHHVSLDTTIDVAVLGPHTPLSVN